MSERRREEKGNKDKRRKIFHSISSNNAIVKISQSQKYTINLIRKLHSGEIQAILTIEKELTASSDKRTRSVATYPQPVSTDTITPAPTLGFSSLFNI